jgi:hypothetical protein
MKGPGVEFKPHQVNDSSQANQAKEQRKTQNKKTQISP